MKYHSEDESYRRRFKSHSDNHHEHPNESTHLSPSYLHKSKNSYNVRSMLVHSPYIPNPNRRGIAGIPSTKGTGTGTGILGSTTTMMTTSSTAATGTHKKSKKQVSKIKARKNISTYRRNKRDATGSDYYRYDTWKGRISVHMEVEEFDLKLLERHVLAKSNLFTKGWKIDVYYDVLRLWLPPNNNNSASTFFSSTTTHHATTAATGTTATGTATASIHTADDNHHDLIMMDSSNTQNNEPILHSSRDIDYLDDGMMPQHHNIMNNIMNSSIEETTIFENETKDANLPPNNNNNNNDNQNSEAMEQEGAASMPEVYIFSFGAVVYWNFETEENEKAWMSEYLFNHEEKDDDSDDDDAIGQQNHPDAIESANDQMVFIYGSEFRIHRDIVQLQTKEYGEKLAVSFALAKSANLSIFEWRLDQVIERNSHIPQELATFGRIHMSRKEISKEIGRIFLVKSGINLENNILDTPEEFWEDDKFNGEYKKAMEYFDIIARLELVNTRLEVMHDMNQILIEATQAHHSSFLEMVVILLIVFEILVEVYRTYRDYEIGGGGD